MADKANILMVDDRADNMVAPEAILSSQNQAGADSLWGGRAPGTASREFAVILIDVLMPGMDGFETAAHIK